jgi:hypothetical protein
MNSTNFMPALTTGLSFACLFQPTAWPTTTHNVILGLGNNSNTGLFRLYYSNDSYVFKYVFYDTTGSAVTFLFPTLVGTQQLNRTYHIAVTQDFATRAVKFYLDGLLVSTQTYTQTPGVVINMPVHMGLDDVHGFLDEVLVTGDRVLTDTEVRSLARAAVGADQSATEFFISTTGSYRNPGTSASPLDIYTGLRSGLAAPGQTYWLEGGTYNAPATGLYSYLTGTRDHPVKVKELAGERAIIDEVNVPLGALDAVNVPDINGITVDGANAEYWDFEVANSNPGAAGANRRESRPIGIKVNGSHLKFIGVLIYDAGNSMFLSTASIDVEVHGCLFFNSGWWSEIGGGAIQSAGHNIYIQNISATERKLVKHSVMWGAASIGYHLYGTASDMTGLDVVGNIMFMNGMWHRDSLAGTNFYFGGHRAITDITVKNNISYVKTGFTGGGYIIGQLGDPHSGLIFQNNKNLGTGVVQLLDYSQVNWSNNLFIYTKPPENKWYMVWARPNATPNIWGSAIKATYIGSGITISLSGRRLLAWTPTRLFGIQLQIHIRCQLLTTNQTNTNPGKALYQFIIHPKAVRLRLIYPLLG